jgi:predicted NBD/HSP70 family sugar kinase
MAGEIGHMVLEQNGPVCFCGSRGCLTMYVSERSILLALEASGATKRSLQEVIKSARQGDAACQRVIHDAGRYLGRALANAAKLLAPSVIAIGGTLGNAGPLLLDSLRSSVEVNSLTAVSPTVQFRTAQIKKDATLYGGVAAVLARVGQGVSAPPEWMKRPA